MVKVAVGIISFNSMPFLVGAIEAIRPYVTQILVADGPVQYWQDQGYTRSTDGSLEYLAQAGVIVVQGRWPEKDEQHNAYVEHIGDDITHVWVVDPDELYRGEDIETVLQILDLYDVVRFRPYHFIDGFERCVHDRLARQRILRWRPGARWLTSRPPTVEGAEEDRILAGKVLARQGILMYHYSHVFAHQVEARLAYYAAHPSGVLMPRGEIQPFTGQHPRWIEENRSWLMQYDSRNFWSATRPGTKQ